MGTGDNLETDDDCDWSSCLTLSPTASSNWSSDMDATDTSVPLDGVQCGSTWGEPGASPGGERWRGQPRDERGDRDRGPEVDPRRDYSRRPGASAISIERPERDDGPLPRTTPRFLTFGMIKRKQLDRREQVETWQRSLGWLLLDAHLTLVVKTGARFALTSWSRASKTTLRLGWEEWPLAMLTLLKLQFNQHSFLITCLLSFLSF